MRAVTERSRWKVHPLCESGDGKTVTHFGIWDHAERRYWPDGPKRWTLGYRVFTDPGVTLFKDRTQADQALADTEGR